MYGERARLPLVLHEPDGNSALAWYMLNDTSIDGTALRFLARLLIIAVVLLSPVAVLPHFGAGPLDVIFLTPMWAVVLSVVWIIGLLIARAQWRRTFKRNLLPAEKLRTFVTSGLAAVACMVLLLWFADRQHAYARVPAPLSASSILFRNDVNAGMGGLPGDNESGFIVLKITAVRSVWALKQGSSLAAKLEGGSEKWKHTPVDYSTREWRNQHDESKPSDDRSLSHFLIRHGVFVDVPQVWIDRFDRAAQSPGSFFKRGRGSVTLVDPANGLVYFAYSG